ncbi:hypothetical protein [Silvibacterium sp.]|uniref:hypothetical protein n=1 Tax=Silvibacterium sp. TaxID=1964179 RepID=UPI0039E47445
MRHSAAGPIALFATAALFAGAAFAQANASNNDIMSGDASLTHPLNTKSAMQGQIVTVQLTNTIHTRDGVELPRGTQLLGKVDAVKSAKDHGPAKLALTFSQARLKDGKTFPIKATLVNYSSANDDGGTPLPVHPDSVIDEAGPIGDTRLHSAVKEEVSGTLTSQRGDIKLPEGTQFLVAVDVVQSPGNIGGAN